MKKILLILFILFLGFIYETNIFSDSLYDYYNKYVLEHDYKIISNKNKLVQNEYHNDVLSGYISETNDYIVKNKKELVNMYFTAINNGYDSLTFYCDKTYNCMQDINLLDKEENSFSYINQLVNVYNSYSEISSILSSNKKVDISITKRYSEEDIKKIDKRINTIINELDINNRSDIKEKIKLFHDYIANTNTYDQEMADNFKSDYNSDTAIGTLFQGKSVCSGYTDTMSIFLNKIGITNTRVSTNNHVWNALLLDGKWYHIDLTWDDPLTETNENIVTYDYYLITTDELLNKKDDEHNFNKEIYNFLYQ